MTGNEIKDRIKFDLACNFDKKLIEEIPKYKIVSWVYGKMETDEIGGGRASLSLPEISWEEIGEYIKLCHRNNIKFNYLLNALCLGNREFIKEYHEKILKILDKISELKVDGVTIASPYLCELIKKQYPHLRISVSVNVEIKVLQHIRYWEDLGADEVTPEQIVNRDFNLLREMLTYTKRTGTTIRLIANNLCLRNCPIKTHHSLAISHASQVGEYTTKSDIHYHYIRCTLLRMMNPVKLISGTWIRPDDLHYYEKLMDETGNENLSMKLVERGSTTEYLLKILKAYSERSYKGNLMDIIYAIQKHYLLRESSKDKKKKNDVFAERIFRGEYNAASLAKLKDIFDVSWFYIDNRKLDGYLDKFVKKSSCTNKICDDQGWGDKKENIDIDSHQLCSYCRKWAEKAIKIDEEKRQQYVANLESFLEDLTTSKVFNLNRA